MGFREPLTSAPGVDTGQGAPGGVRMYQTAGGDYPTGTLEFYSGIAESSAFLTASVYAVNQGEGWTSNGSTTELRGMNDHGVTAPATFLDVVPDPAGGYSGAAGVRNAATFDLGGARLTNAPDLSDSGWLNMGLGAGFTVGGDGARYRKVGKLVSFQLHATMTTATWTGRLSNFPAAWRPTVTHWWVAQYGGVVQGEIRLTADGALTLLNRPATGAQGGIVVAGTFPAG